MLKIDFQQLKKSTKCCSEKRGFTPPRKTLINSTLLKWWMFVFILTLLKGFLPLQAQTSNPIYNAVYYYVGSPSPDSFMLESNQQIIDRLKELNCNAIFLFFKVSQSEANLQNLGLYVYPQNASFPPYTGKYCYRDKLTDFIHQATQQQVPIKVFALQIDNEKFKQPGWADADTVIYKISYYQLNVKAVFPNKNALLNGVVTNVEPWDISSSDPIFINGTAYSWKNSFCNSANRINNNTIMNHYLAFAQFIKNKFFAYGFYSYLTPYPVDKKILGTTQWYMHYYSQKYPSEFPAGNFSQLANASRFDYIIPQTYCSKSDQTCQSAACINPNLTSFCTGNYTDGEPVDNEIPYDESTGKCLEWFEKHMLSNQMYSGFSNYTLPIDAAPLLFGHSAYMFTTRAALKNFRDNVRYLARVCYGKDNDKGSVIFKYSKAFQLPAGIPTYTQVICENDPKNSLMEQRYISAYPNPASNELYLEGLRIDDQLMLRNLISGQTLQLQAGTIINISHLPEGWYLLLINDYNGNEVYRDKIYIKH